MTKAVLGLFVVLWTMSAQLPALAHVKWFLEEGEADLLAQPKPDMFCRPTWENILVVGAGLIALHLATVLGRRWSGWSLNHRLIGWSVKYESVVTLILGVFTGTLMIVSAQDYVFLVPNMPIDDRVPEWFAAAELWIGIGLVVGFFSRACALALLCLLAGAFTIFPMLDCLDLIPMYGIALYILIAGRGRYSLDCLTRLSRPVGPILLPWAYRFLRWATGIGLVVLGLDEKLLHPQLALNILEHTPMLNFMSCVGMPNELFVLCAGVAEVFVGLVILSGSFPRLGALFLSGLFVCTTLLFGEDELIGHMPYYGVVVALLLRGSGGYPVPALQIAFQRLVPALQKIVVSKNQF